MSANRSSYLLAAFLSVLASHGLAAEALDPWRGWVSFKRFAREVVEFPDPGISVQLMPLGDRAPVRLAFVRQVLEPAEDRLEPVGGVVCEFTFAPLRRTPAEWRVWSFDSASFERFVDLVEQHPVFSDLLATAPLSSEVYWEDA
jgi:hypothetical protein